MPHHEQCNACQSFQATHYKLELFETNHKGSMNYWESIANIALCSYKLVSNHKYMHMYKSRNKKNSYRLSLLRPFHRSSSLLPCHLHDRTWEILSNAITDLS